ncbi:MAG: hypothetical protein JXM70_27310 [Pirellulales bacterium]|nr:hypothetical protein [Pirellulales bacterium]
MQSKSLAIVIISITLAGLCPAQETAVLKIGTAKQLLVDDHVIAEKNNVTRRLGRVTKANQGRPVMVADKPWEDDLFGFYGTVIHDGKKFRMWYHPWAFAVAYAESNDGLHWEKPALGLYDFSIQRAKNEPGIDGGFHPREGSCLDFSGKQNNIVGFFGDGFTCYLDPHETDPQHKYKACYGHPTKIRACLAHSPDGIHWTHYNKGEPVTGRASDTYNQIVWDEAAKTYRLFTRTDFARNGTEIRGTRGMVNPDLKTAPTAWKTVRSWKFDREGPQEHLRRQIYGMTDWIHESVHFAIMLVYEWPDNPPLKTTGVDHLKRHERDVMNFYIATSRDGDDWDLSWVYAQKPLVPRGPDGSFDKDMILPSSNIVTHDDRHWIYYTGYRERHWRIPRKPAIGLATLPLDRFVCLQAGPDPGTVVTRPFRLEGGKLELNADARAGKITLSLLTTDGKPLRGFSEKDAVTFSNVDGLRLEPSWNHGTGLVALKGKTVRLKFILKNAALYAFQVRP